MEASCEKHDSILPLCGPQASSRIRFNWFCHFVPKNTCYVCNIRSYEQVSHVNIIQHKQRGLYVVPHSFGARRWANNCGYLEHHQSAEGSLKISKGPLWQPQRHVLANMWTHAVFEFALPEPWLSLHCRDIAKYLIGLPHHTSAASHWTCLPRWQDELSRVWPLSVKQADRHAGKTLAAGQNPESQITGSRWCDSSAPC